MIWRFDIHEALASTSDFCRGRAEAGDDQGLVVLAKEQSAARGSRGRSWTTGKGNLAFSFVCRIPENSTFLQALPFLTAVALYEGMTACLPASFSTEKHFTLKWPNDLLLHQCKMAGILIETGHNETHQWAVIGIGANLKNAPKLPDRRLACFADLATPPDAEECARKIIHSFDKWKKEWEEKGSSVVHQAWLSYAHPIGTRLAVQGRDTYKTGMFSGLDAQGHLLLTLDNGDVLPVVTGDILCE
ncbi:MULTISPECIES: biotin--[acetyl-CoA-carboxylase] ligase [unclassified Saccharibacter]|uniref:biotin--[acetyl-CoA-carboxylase] ligase n=1 Tax=unclassified Saccharibacter TaxID=2648722 RepID=UPI0013232FA1|nr:MULTISPECIES: biotin--[acetyl-CoA-carboxylase] ligase [unclassified Saccharibacter]MXV35428.1 biotin--[acetyl-CoA-carboxylase] ligase [Saccharibacter sp. EH611]MXV58088.1 biotin--[acetyl-CoA-carboxylase] ligase [Saccharibacter sp. EH70]MXV65362.1 biotin--[acetyl-CoA-carboxylase] ligase [Saccharibacter sp. EH60]